MNTMQVQMEICGFDVKYTVDELLKKISPERFF